MKKIVLARETSSLASQQVCLDKEQELLANIYQKMKRKRMSWQQLKRTFRKAKIFQLR